MLNEMCTGRAHHGKLKKVTFFKVVPEGWAEGNNSNMELSAVFLQGFLWNDLFIQNLPWLFRSAANFGGDCTLNLGEGGEHLRIMSKRTLYI